MIPYRVKRGSRLFRSGSRFRRATGWVALSMLILSLVPMQLSAADSWFSKVRSPQGPEEPLGGRRKSVSSQSLFDVTMSLYNDPSGDEDPDHDTGSEQQTTYEQIVRFWADGVCEESNGAHKLGRVRIFRKGAFPAADVIWNASEHPRADASGFGVAGQHLIFGDVFPDGAGTGHNLNMLDDPEASGYTLAHEWGHYVYGLYDEYRGQEDRPGDPFYFPRTSDTPTSPSIMSNQWKAAASRGGDLSWLNYSTSNNYQADTGQGRAYGASGWEVLARPSKDDPRKGPRNTLPERKQYTTLAAVQPTAADSWIHVELPAAQASCRSELKIQWMDEEDLEFQLVIDRSGSMAGSPLDNAKRAAQTLIDVVPQGLIALGVETFDDTVRQDVPIIPVPDDATKTTIKNAIGTISAGGSTALFDAAGGALDGLESYRNTHHTNANRVVFLLTDGLDNSSSLSQSDVTAAYLAADVPLITFGYGQFAPDGVLRELADDTGGLFYASPTSFTEIQNAFLAAIASVSSTQALSSFQSQAPASGGAVLDRFEVDGTLESLTLLVNYDGPLNGLQLSVAAPNGPVSVVAFSCQATGSVNSCVAQVSAAVVTAGGTGTWTLNAVNASGGPVTASGSVVANPAAGRTYDLVAASASGSTVNYPEPIVLTAAVAKGARLTGVEVKAKITAPDGTFRTLPLHDDGRNGDGIAGDGTYSLLLGYDDDGTYAVDIDANNDAGAATYAVAGYAASPDANGNEPPRLAPVPVPEKFQRQAHLQINVSGVASSGGDDHPDTPPGTPLPADNTEIAGRIDRAGDLDYFAIQGIQPGQPLAVRVTDTALGMMATLSLYRPDGTLLRSGNLSNAASRNGYVFLVLQPGEIDPSGTLLARVEDATPGASGGTYSLSAGPALDSDRTAGPGSCTAGPEVLCLNRGRFAVRIAWEDFSGNHGTGHAVPLTDSTGYFWFFGPNNVEIALNLSDNLAANGHYGVTYAALSNVKYTLQVTDTATGNTATYANPTGRFASVRDPQALPGSVTAASSHRWQVYQGGSAPKGRWIEGPRTRSKQACTQDATHLCLGNGRFRVEVTWTDAQGKPMAGQAASLTSDTGTFWFSDSKKIDLLFKTLDGRGVNGRFWMFFGGLSDDQYTIKVTDTSTGRKRSYVNHRGELASGGDTLGFRSN